MQIEDIRIEDFDLSLMALRLMNESRALQVERSMKIHGQLQPVDLNQHCLSKLVGHSPSWLSRRLSLISRLDEEITADIKMGVLSSRHARALIRLPRGNQSGVARTGPMGENI